MDLNLLDLIEEAVRYSPNAVAISRLRDGLFVYAGDEIEPMMGFRPTDLVGKHSSLLDVWVDAADRELIVSKLKAGEKLTHVQMRTRHKDGSIRQVLVSFRLLHHAGEDYIATYLADDLTRHDQEQLLATNQKRLESLLQLSDMRDASEHEIFRYGVEAAAQITNSEFAYLHLYQNETQTLHLEAWSKGALETCNVAYQPSYPLKDAGIWADAVRKRHPVITNDYLAEPLRKGLPEGHVTLQRHLSVPIIEHDQVVAIAGVGNRSTPYTSSDALQLSLLADGIWQQVRRRRKELEQLDLIRSAMDGYVQLDLQGNILDVNPIYCGMSGYSASELLGMNVADLDLVIASEQVMNYIQRVVTNGRSRFETRHRRKDGSSFEAEISAIYSPVDQGRLSVFVRDISERIRNERMLYNIARGVSSSTGKAFFRDMVDHLAQALEVEYTFVAELIEPDTQTLKIIASVDDAELREQVTYRANYAPCGQVLLNGQAVYASGVQQLFPHDQALVKLGIEGYAGIRLNSSENQPLGVLTVLSRRPFTNPMQVERMLTIFASRAEVEMDRMRRDAALQDAQNKERLRLLELEAVNRVSAALRSTQSLDEMLPVILDETLSILKAEAGLILLISEDRTRVTNKLGRGWLERINEVEINPQSGLANMVLETGRLVQTTANDTRNQQAVRGLVPDGWNGVILPIRALNEIVGVMDVSVPAPRQMTRQEIHLLETISDIAGNAVHRTRLHERTERSLQRIATLHEIDVAIAGNLDLHHTLSLILENALRIIKVDAASVMLLDFNMQRLEFAVGRGFRSREVERVSLPVGEGLPGRVALERRRLMTNDLAFVEATTSRTKVVRAEGFVFSCVVPLISKGQVMGVLELFNRSALDMQEDELEFVDMLAGQAALGLENLRLFDRMQRSHSELVLAYNETIEGWSRAMDLRDRDTDQHTQRVTNLTVRLARAMNLSDEEVAHIRRGALLHDIGKMGVPDEVLNKPGPLTEDEWKLMRRHPQLAFDMLSPVRYLRPAIEIPYNHHERWDGTGYPRGLKGTEIPMAARLFAVVDVWDALLNDRPYRKAWSHDEVIRFIQEESGKAFDPDVVRVFLNIVSESKGPSS